MQGGILWVMRVIGRKKSILESDEHGCQFWRSENLHSKRRGEEKAKGLMHPDSFQPFCSDYGIGKKTIRTVRLLQEDKSRFVTNWNFLWTVVRCRLKKKVAKHVNRFDDRV